MALRSIWVDSDVVDKIDLQSECIKDTSKLQAINEDIHDGFKKLNKFLDEKFQKLSETVKDNKIGSDSKNLTEKTPDKMETHPIKDARQPLVNQPRVVNPGEILVKINGQPVLSAPNGQCYYLDGTKICY